MKPRFSVVKNPMRSIFMGTHLELFVGWSFFHHAQILARFRCEVWRSAVRVSATIFQTIYKYYKL